MDLFLSTHPSLLWLVLGIVCFLVEVALPGFFVFFFGVGAWCAALVALVPKMPITIQILVFLITSIVCLFLFQAKFKQMFKGTTIENGTDDDFVPHSEPAEVIEDILPPAFGKVKYRGSFWQASSSIQVSKGEFVQVLSKNNLCLTVEPVQTPQESVNE